MSVFRQGRQGGYVLVVGALALSLVACGSSSKSGGGSKKPSSYTIGAALPLSGAAANVGADFSCGIQAAVHEINGAGGIDGVKVNTKILDNLGTASGSVSAFNQMASSNIKSVIMTTSAGIKATAPLATKQEALMLNPGGSDPTLAGISPYLFTNITSIEGELSVMVPYLRAQGFKSIAMYGQNDALGTSGAATLKKLWEAAAAST